jgi:UDP-glucose 4-epimerase
MVIPRFVDWALAGRPLQIHGDGAQTRCFCHIEDTIRALVGLMDEQSTSGEIFNIGSTNRIRIIDLAERVKELTGSDSELVYVPYEHVFGQGIEDMLHRSPAIEKIRGAIGWEPERDLDTILRDVIAYSESLPAEFEEPEPADVV